MSELALDGLCKRFGALAVVDGFSLRVASGELLVLVGPSGCGKTTALRLVAGFETPDAGRITLDGQDLGATPPEKRGVGFVFQHQALFPHLDVAANVGYGLRFSKHPNPKARVAEMLALVGLAGLERRTPEQLSAGQRQRVALARALAPKPRVLLLDEPLSALDVQLRQRLRGEVRNILKTAGTTALYVTHDQEEALAIADRLAVMHEGKLLQIGTPQAVYRQPATRFVAEFVGQGNVIEAQVEAVTANACVVRVGEVAFELPIPTAQVGARLALVVRPEHVRLDGLGAVRFEATLRQAEFLGPWWRVWLDWDGLALTCLSPTAPDPEGGALTASFDPGHLWPLPR